MLTMTKLGENVKRLREARGLRMVDLGAKIEKGHSQVSQIESGKIDNPRIDTLVALADAFSVTTDELLGRVVDYSDLREVQQVLDSLKVEEPYELMRNLAALSTEEQRVIARLVRLSATDRQGKVRQVRKVAEQRANYEVGS